MAQEHILEIINNHPEGINGNGIKKELGVKWGVSQQVERLREKGLVDKRQGETRLTWIYTPAKKQEATK